MRLVSYLESSFLTWHGWSKGKKALGTRVSVRPETKMQIDMRSSALISSSSLTWPPNC